MPISQSMLCFICWTAKSRQPQEWTDYRTPMWFFCEFQPQLSLLHLPHCLITLSLSAGVVPRQWKNAIITPITPVPKILIPTVASDYRPISVTSTLSPLVERRIVTRYIYRALNVPTPGLNFANQYAFRPTGSTTAALVAIYHTVCTMLSSNQFVRVFVLDFSKAFDSIRHNRLFAKLSALSIPDEIYNWITHFLLTGGIAPNLEVTC